ncbi:hypothetical protein [Sphingobium sp. IP1]|uniref:hypothetical protein n=1 Tax=Sphingobium sp. IP1 TaxID=2021637 RepID=UPI001C5585C3|nr:hypothetical protein [Sphingobium sp. IP1]
MFFAVAVTAGATTMSIAAPPNRAEAARGAVHPVSTELEMKSWLDRVPHTSVYPPDFEATLRGQGSAYVIEMSTAPGCLPCGDLWTKLRAMKARYGWSIRTITTQEAIIRSGRLGLPWIGHPVAWVRPLADPNRIIPVAIGTDHAVNISRNLYLAAKMQTGVRVGVAVRAMSKFTGIVSWPQRARLHEQ